jgi:transposase
MEYFAGLDVAMEESAICVIDREGKVVLETKVTTDPDAIFKVLKPYVAKLRRIGHEAIVVAMAAGRAQATWLAGHLS